MKFQIADLAVQGREFRGRIVGRESWKELVDRKSQRAGDHGVTGRIAACEPTDDVVGEQIVGRAADAMHEDVGHDHAGHERREDRPRPQSQGVFLHAGEGIHPARGRGVG